MTAHSSIRNTARLCAASALGLALVTLSGCGLSNTVQPNSVPTAIPLLSGKINGGPNPVGQARVVLYTTGDSSGASTGYGIGNSVQTATSDNDGNFHFSAGYTCPANQYAYIAVFGGKTGSNTANPNSILLATLGPCGSVGGFVIVNELTTIAAGYALSNFINVTGNAVSGYAVGIGAPASNNAASACVVNTYYPTCTGTAAAGLKHAFALSQSLVSTTTGQPNATTAGGAIVPVPLINTLGNILQACVNSTGGGTDGSGLPTTTTSAGGTTNDGTTCGKLFAYTSYTLNGQPSGTLVAAGNTLSAIQNLAKRPSGSATTFDSACSSTAGTTNNAATCIYNLGTPVGVYQTSMTSAPPDWILGIAYPKSSFATGTGSTFATPTGPACGNSTTTNGLLYPTYVTTDVNDNVVILNGDASTPICANIIAIGADGTVLGNSTIDNTDAAVVSVAVDAYGHAILPVKNANGVKFYQYAAGGTADANDGSIPLLATITGANTSNAANKAQFAVSDSNGRIYLSAQNAAFDFGYLQPTVPTHSTAIYAVGTFTNTTTSSLVQNSVDLNNNAFTVSTTRAFGATPIGTAFTTSTTGSTYTGGSGIGTDAFNNVWQATGSGTATVILKYPYTPNGATVTFGTPSTLAAPTYSFPTVSNTQLENGVNTGIKNAAMDGNNVLWFGDLFGQTATAPAYGSFLRGYDTVNNYGTTQLQGCKFTTASTYSITGWTIGASSTTFTLSNTTPPSVGAVVNLSGFPTSTFFNGQQVTVTASASGTPASFTVANVFGQAASSGTDPGTASSRGGTACGSNSGDSNYPSNTPYLLYQTRGIAVDTMGNIWVANGTQATVTELIGIAAPTLPNYIHNGVSNKP